MRTRAQIYARLALAILYTTPPGLFFGCNNVDLHVWELSWLGFANFMRPTATTAWTQTMGIESTRLLRRAYVDGQLVVGSIALNGADLAATLANP